MAGEFDSPSNSNRLQTALSALRGSVYPWDRDSAETSVVTALLFQSGGSGSTVYTLSLNSGTFTLSGNSATILKFKVLTANFGSFSFYGQSAVFQKYKAINADSGHFNFLGQVATLAKVSAGVFIIEANSGSFLFSGKSATFQKSKIINGHFGSFYLISNNASISWITSGYPSDQRYVLTSESKDFSISSKTDELIFYS